MHVYDKGRLHLIKVTAKSGTEEIIGYGFNGGTAATRPLSIFPKFVDLFRPALIGRDVTDTAYVSRLAENYKIYGPGGYHTQVIAAINQACWDIRGKLEESQFTPYSVVRSNASAPTSPVATTVREKGFDELR